MKTAWKTEAREGEGESDRERERKGKFERESEREGEITFQIESSLASALSDPSNVSLETDSTGNEQHPKRLLTE